MALDPFPWSGRLTPVTTQPGINTYIPAGSISITSLPDNTGPTANRPPNPTAGTRYLDTTLNQPIEWNGTAWINAAGAVV